jgi:kynureninase
MGHAAPFAFGQDYAPAPGIRRLLSGTPPILAMAALEAGVALVAEAGMPRIAAKARALGDLFIAAVERLEVPGLGLVSPRRGRGGHVMLSHGQAHALVQALIARGVTGDFRAPDGARFGFAPLPLSHADVVEAAAQLGAVIAGNELADPRFHARRAVT